MRTKIFLILILFIFCNSVTLFAQRKHAVYVELLGTSIFYSVNYDERLSDQVKGWGISIGGSFIPDSGKDFISAFIKPNYLLGNEPHYFELSSGLIYQGGDATFLGDYQYKRRVGIASSMMYRLQTHSGFLLKSGLGYTPLGNGYAVVIGISIGKAF